MGKLGSSIRVLGNASIFVLISTAGFVPPWLFLNYPSELAQSLGPTVARGVLYGGWFLLAAIAGRLALKFTKVTSIRQYCALSAISLCLGALFLFLLPNWIGLLLAAGITASINGAIMFGPFLGAAIRTFPQSSSVAIAFATVGQLTAATASDQLMAAFSSIVSATHQQAVTLLFSALTVLLVSRLITPPIDLPSVSVERKSSWIISLAFAFAGFCVTFSGTIFIVNLPELARFFGNPGTVFAVFSICALVGRVAFAYVQDISSLPMHVLTAIVLSLGLCITTFFDYIEKPILVMIAAAMFALGYGGVTPTYLSKQSQFFSGLAGSKQSFRFFIFASTGILLGCLVSAFLYSSAMLLVAFLFSLSNLVLICWLSVKRPAVYGTHGI
ncbi:MAG: hypothetical protein JXR14_02495 [Paracoccaceae bacterium]